MGEVRDYRLVPPVRQREGISQSYQKILDADVRQEKGDRCRLSVTAHFIGKGVDFFLEIEQAA